MHLINLRKTIQYEKKEVMRSSKTDTDDENVE